MFSSPNANLVKMKTFEMLVFVGSFVFLIGVFCKVPKIFFDSELKNGFMKLMNSLGTAIVLIAPMFYITSVSCYISFESEPMMTERPLLQKWMLFALITLGLTLTYILILGMIRSAKNSLKSCSDTLVNLATVLTMEAIKKEAGSEKGYAGSKGFFYEAGKNFSKGMNENFPGDDWKKGGEDDDEDPPASNRFGRN